MSIHEFLRPPSFIFKDGVYYQTGVPTGQSFETQYLLVREKENRIYPDDIVAKLPEIPIGHPLNHEWKVRAESSKRLVQYLKFKNDNTILEIGCGNGWLSNQLSKLPTQVCGLDINEMELSQASRIFSSAENLAFVFGDIYSVPFPKFFFDIILLPSVIQYFPDVKKLLTRLFEILSPKGEIHIIDSPLYKQEEIESARKRTFTYYSQLGFPDMANHYHHHSWDEFDPYDFKLLHDPLSISSKIKRVFGSAHSAFPWIVLSKSY